jgi:hypothetical protein
MSYYGPERRIAAELSEEQIELIAEKAAEKALQKVYANVGKGIVNKLAFIIGACVIGILLWMGGKGINLK